MGRWVDLDMRGELKFFAGVAIGVGIGVAIGNLGIGIGIGNWYWSCVIPS